MKKNSCDNKIWCRLHSPRHKEILAESAEKHYTGNLSGFLKNWFVIIARLVQADIQSELLIINIDKLLEFCKKLRGENE